MANGIKINRIIIGFNKVRNSLHDYRFINYFKLLPIRKLQSQHSIN